MAEDYAAALASFESAVARLRDALAQPETEWTRDAAIQRFEFSIELAWRTIARFARREGIDSPSPRQAFRTALRLKWIEDDAVWLDMLDDRNRSSHTYDVAMAEELFRRLPKYVVPLARLGDSLRRLLETGEDTPSSSDEEQSS